MEEEEAPDVDGHFFAAFLTALAEAFPRGKRKTPPVARLVAELFAETAKLAGSSVKETRWKKATRFVDEELREALATRERSPGVAEVVDVDWSLVPAFEPVVPPPKVDDARRTALKKATKRGSRVTVALRRVRNKNCTFIDGLDSWGFSQDDLAAIAAVFRSRFSAAASVSPRKGMADNPHGKRLWSIMVQGKYVEQIATTLRSDLAVTNVQTTAPKGMLTKLDRAAKV